MRYRFGNYFGATAVHLMFMTEAEIDRIFDFTSLKADTMLILHNLYTEVEALRKIFDEEPTQGIPHVILMKNNTAPEVSDLIKGFNALLERKSQMATSDTLVEEDESSDFNFSAFENTKDSHFSSAGAESTSLFSDSDLDSLSPLSEESSGSSGFMSLFDEVSPKSEDFDIDFQTNIEPEYTDLISIGKNTSPTEQKVKNILQLSRYLMTHKDDFSEEERASIMQQVADLPKTPTAIELPSQFVEACKTLSPHSLAVLTSLYNHMQRKVKPKNTNDSIPFVEYVSEKIRLLLTAKISTVKQLFFASQSMFSTDLSLVRWHDIVLDLNNTYLSQKYVSTILGNLETLIADCNEVLGRTSNSVEINNIAEFKKLSSEYLDLLTQNVSSSELEYKQSEWGSKLLELLGRAAIPENYQAQTIQCFLTLLKTDKLMPLLNNVDNLRMLAYLNVALYRVVSSELGSKLNRELFNDVDNSDLDEVVRICTPVYRQFTCETGILGFQCKYSPRFLKTITEVVTPLDQAVTMRFPEESVNYKLSALLRKHLKSLQKRLIK